MSRLALLLPLARGGGAFTRIPEQGRWVRQGAVLVPSEAWENDGILEPTVLNDGTWKMWYRGGGLHGPNEALGYATSADGITWSKSGSNPIFGNGVAGESSRIICPYVVKVGATYYLYYSRLTDNTHKVATSSDGTSWTVVGTTMAKPATLTYWGNTVAWNEGGSTWKMLVEGYVTADALWKTFYATSTNGTTWTLGNGGAALSTLSPGGLFGAPSPPYLYNGRYHGWYHGAVSGNLPTDIYRAHSADLITWTIVSPSPILTHTGADYEIDQVADPSVLEVAGTSYMYYDADDNVGEVAAIKLATFAGSLGNLISGT